MRYQLSRGVRHAQIEEGIAGVFSESDDTIVRGDVACSLLKLLERGLTEDDVAVEFSGERLCHAIFTLEKLIKSGLVVEMSHNIHDLDWLQSGCGVSERLVGPTSLIDFIDLADAPGVLDVLQRTLESVAKCPDYTQRERLVVVIVNDYLQPELEDVVATQCLLGASLILVKPFGREVWIGPLLRPSEPSVWIELRDGLRRHRPLRAIAFSKGSLNRVGRISSMGSLQIVAALLTLEVEKILADAPSAIAARVVTVDVFRTEICSHQIVFDYSENAGKVGLAKIGAIESQLRDQLPLVDIDGGSRTVSAEERLNCLHVHVSPISGVVPTLTRLRGISSIPVFVSTNSLGAVATAPAALSRRSYRTSSAAGKGFSVSQAKVSCIAEAIERSSISTWGNEEVKFCSVRELDLPAIAPSRLTQFSPAQYESRLKNNNNPLIFERVPEPFDPSVEIGWLPSWDLVNQRVVWLPASSCLLEYQLDPVAFSYADSNGCASGGTLVEATIQALMELVERDACAIWWYNMLSMPAFDISTDEQICSQIYPFEAAGRVVHFLDLTTDLGIPVVVAVASNRNDGGQVEFGLGAHFNATVAARRALSELAQIDAMNLRTRFVADPNSSSGWLHKWYSEVTTVNARYLRPSTESKRPVQRWAPLPDRCRLGQLNEHLAKAGVELFLTDLSRERYPLKVVRVTSPQLRHFWPRFASGRLYSVPTTLGWLHQAPLEASLNPFPVLL